MADATILDSRQVPSLDPARRGKIDRLIFYQVEGGATQLLILPDEQATEAGIRAGIQKEQATRASLIGKRLTL